MLHKNITRILVVLFLIVINVGCDQVSKKIVRKNVAPDEMIQVITNHLTITNVENTGAFLSLGNDLSEKTKNVALSVLPLAALVFGFGYVLLKRNLPAIMLIGFCFIIGGGIGNIFDRISYGSVTDFLHIKAFGLQTGIFNMADVSIMTGVAIVLVHSFLTKKKRTELQPEIQHTMNENNNA